MGKIVNRIMMYTTMGAFLFGAGYVLRPRIEPKVKDAKKTYQKLKNNLVNSMPEVDDLKKYTKKLEKEKKELEKRVGDLESKVNNTLPDNKQYESKQHKRIPNTAIPKIDPPKDDPYRDPSNITPNIAPLEQYMISLVNEQRRMHGVPELKYNDPRLFDAARQHSREMMEMGYFSHASPVKRFESIGGRYELAGILPISKDSNGWMRYAENISWAGSCSSSIDKRFVEVSMFGGELDKLYQDHGEVYVRTSSFRQDNCIVGEEYDNDITSIGGLVGSKGHRKNMLDPKLTHIGVGIVAGYGTYEDGKQGYGIWVTQDFAAFRD